MRISSQYNEDSEIKRIDGMRQDNTNINSGKGSKKSSSKTFKAPQKELTYVERVNFILSYLYFLDKSEIS